VPNPCEDVKRILDLRLINIAQTHLGMGPSLAPVGRAGPPMYPKRLADSGRNCHSRGHHGGGPSELLAGRLSPRANEATKYSNRKKGA